MQSITPIWLKRVVMFTGLILVIIGIPFTINLLCIFPLTVINNYRGNEMMQYGVVSLILVFCTLGAGIVALRNGDRSLKNEPSQPLWLPSPILLLGIFVPLLLVGIIFEKSGAGVLFLPLFLLIASILPPLWSVAWMMPQSFSPKKSDQTNAADERAGETNSPSLTWRRGLLSFTGGATFSVLIAIVLEILLPVIVLSLVSNFADSIFRSVGTIFRALSNGAVARALTNPAFVFIFLQVAVIAPIVEEFAKPLVTLPLLKNLSRKEAFWLGALAGAGFAVLENVIYATVGLSIWAGILIVRALGSALHPLGSGLVAVGWRDVINKESGAHANWWRRFGIAVAIHALWNGGSLLVITLGSAGFFGQLPRDLNILGVSATGITLAFLLVLGISVLWVGRAYGHDQPLLLTENAQPSEQNGFIPSDRAVAIWGIVCLVAIVPAGIAGLKLWLR